MSALRVRFAPSPTGALHIGGVRTALYNYLLAKKENGTFLIRIEDTDQGRYVEGAEEYILNSLRWLGIMPTEGPNLGGDFAPYRQSERKELYAKYVQELLDNGHAYYAFDTPEEIEAQREAFKASGKTFQYDASTRDAMRNSLTLNAADTTAAREGAYVVRMKIPANELVVVQDIIRGAVTIASNTLDDKVLMKGDGMPTYHLANIVDDHLMEISHVIRGEEWLPSAAHHVLLYRSFGWADTMPKFAHLPLILKPDGNGKLSKRDGAKFGFPVFPMSWKDEFKGFDEYGFEPQAVINFLALLGWNSGSEQEIFSLDELVQRFSLEKITKSGARFDFNKAKWFNQQYLMAMSNEALTERLRPAMAEKGYAVSDDFMHTFCSLMKERVIFLTDFLDKGYYFFERVKTYDDETIKKKWKSENAEKFDALLPKIEAIEEFNAINLETTVKEHLHDAALKPGDLLPMLRIALCGTMQGPAVYDMAALLGKAETVERLRIGFEKFKIG
jgi:glutamyl-tRNA synthetase